MLLYVLYLSVGFPDSLLRTLVLLALLALLVSVVYVLLVLNVLYRVSDVSPIGVFLISPVPWGSNTGDVVPIGEVGSYFSLMSFLPISEYHHLANGFCLYEVTILPSESMKSCFLDLMQKM